MSPVPRCRRGFSLIEMLVVLAVIVILAALLLPVLAQGKEKARRIKCISNLKQIGIAAKTFGMDRDGNFPWHTHSSEGGTYGTLMVRSTWGNFSAMSNELVTPLVLSCPSDKGTKMLASSWPELWSAAFQSNAVSFWVGLDAFEDLPGLMLAGDGNITGGISDTCGSVIDSGGVMAREYKPGNSSIRWLNSIHGKTGDIALSDGSVQRLNNRELLELVDINYRTLTNAPIRSFRGRRLSNHILPPRNI